MILINNRQRVKKMRNAFFLSMAPVIFTLTPIISQAQDFTFSQFYEMPLLRNPAMAGLFNSHLQVKMAHRSQWSSITIPFQTQSLSIEWRKKMGNAFFDHMTFGAQINNDQAGDSKLGRIEILPVFNFHKLVDESSRSFLSFAVMGGIVQSKFDPTALTFDEQFQNGQFNPSNPSRAFLRQSSVTHGDLSTGLSYRSGSGTDRNKFYVGASAFHLLKPKVSFFDNSSVWLKTRYVLNAGVSTEIGEYQNLSFFGDYITQGGNRQILSGFLFNHIFKNRSSDNMPLDQTGISVGMAYRWADAVIPVARLEFRKYTLGFSYDANISKLKTFTQARGGFEITFSFNSFLNLQLQHEDTNLQGVLCPKGPVRSW